MLAKRHLLLTLFLSLAACDDVVTDVKQAGLDELVDDEVADNDFVGAGVSVRLDNGDRLRSSAGHIAPLGGEAYDANHTEQVIGSVTKLYTAVLVLQLVEQGRIGVDDPVDQWLSFEGAAEISVRMLLKHTSGLNDYLNLIPLPELGRVWAPEELLEVALAAGSVGAPGLEKAVYSNTNFLVLALIVEAETGTSWEENIETRIAAPLGLRHTYFAGESSKNDHLAGGWLQTEGGWIDILSVVDASVGWGVGGLVATNAELYRFTTALFDGELFASPATLAAMRDFDTEMDPAYQDPAEPPTSIGLGMLSMRLDGVTLEGHLGHIEGYHAGALRNPARDEIIVVTANDYRAWAGPLAYEVARYLRDF